MNREKQNVIQGEAAGKLCSQSCRNEILTVSIKIIRAMSTVLHKDKHNSSQCMK
jgi:hypothetical protein